MTTDKRRKLRTADLKRFQRLVSQKTIETCWELEAGVGAAQAINYERISGGQGSQHAGSMDVYVTIDFCADVLKVAKDTLTGDDLAWYLRVLKKTDYDLSKQTEENIRVHERIGRVLLSRGLFTFTRYKNAICTS